MDLTIERLRAVAAVEVEPVRRAVALSDLAHHLYVRFQSAGAEADLQEAIDADERALGLATPRTPEHLKIVGNLAILLATRFSGPGRRADLDRAIALVDQLHLDEQGPDPSPDLPAILNTFAVLLTMRHDRGGPRSDVDQAVATASRAVALTAEGDPDVGIYNSTLADALARRFRDLRRRADLDAAIEAGRSALGATEKDDPYLPARLSALAVHLQSRHDLDEDPTGEDLDAAISLVDWAVDLTSPRSPHRWVLVSTLAASLSRRSERPGSRADLDRSIDLFREVLDVAGVGSALHRPGHLNDLAIRLAKRYKLDGNPADRDEMARRMGEWADLCEGGAGGRHEVTVSGPHWVHDLAAMAERGDSELWGLAARVGHVLLGCAARLGSLPGDATEEERRIQATRVREAVDGIAALTALATLRAGGDSREALVLLESGLTTMAVERSGRLRSEAPRLRSDAGQLVEDARRNDITLTWVAVTDHGGIVGRLGADGSWAVDLRAGLTTDAAVDWHARLHPVAEPTAVATRLVRGPEMAGIPTAAEVGEVLDELSAALGDAIDLTDRCWLVPVGLLAALPWQARWPAVHLHTSGALHALARDAARREAPKMAAIIVDPDGNLPHAATEGLRVSMRLKGGPDGYHTVIRSGLNASLQALFDVGTPGVLHVGAHGSDEPALKLARNARLRPEHLSDRPDVFGSLRVLFPNCCLSGALPPSHLDEAAGFATAAGVAGAASTVAALWPVDDATAAQFADHFYDHFTREADPHAALRHAREVTRPAEAGDPSVLAYQLYGH